MAEFLLDKPANNPSIIVEKVSSGGGEIRSAHLKSYGSKVYVKGLVVRRPAGYLPPWAHVDVIVEDKSSKIVEGISVNYIPRDIPYGNRGEMARSQYIARLASMPAKDSKVRVVLHVAHEYECEFGNGN